MSNFDVVVIGGGAAGLFCAIEAGRRRKRVLVIERNSQVGRKIIISGGGRCNFTNIYTSAENFISRNPHFCKSALAGFTPADFVELVKRHRIAFYEKKLGQLFCRESSRAIVNMLLAECERNRVKIVTQCSVEQVERSAKTFKIKTSAGDFQCESLVIAAGGLSFPKVGATDIGYSIARQFGLKIEPTRPSLVPLIFDTGDNRSSKLAGISVDSNVSTNGHTFRENILFTHRGLSGPAILQISNYWNSREPVTIDLIPDRPVSEVLQSARSSGKTIGGELRKLLPERVVSEFCPEQIARKTGDTISPAEASSLADAVSGWKVRFKTTEGYDKAEVTIGGVSTDALSSKTMEVKSVPGLYFIGEVVDVTGWLGGFNFQWAWASAHAAGMAV